MLMSIEDKLYEITCEAMDEIWDDWVLNKLKSVIVDILVDAIWEKLKSLLEQVELDDKGEAYELLSDYIGVTDTFAHMICGEPESVMNIIAYDIAEEVIEIVLKKLKDYLNVSDE
jgi:hypothetical protein